jgi:hypothetical protein
VLKTSPLAAGVAYTLTVNGVTDAVGNPIAANSMIVISVPSSETARAQDPGPDGLLVLEAEHFNMKVARSDHEWVLTTAKTGFSGDGAMEATPNTGLNVQNKVDVSPRLDFKVLFVKTGVHHIWVRGFAAGGADDSVHIGLNGALPATSDRISPFPPGAFVWLKTTLDASAPATFEVTAPGLQSVNVWMREDGFIIDKIVITTNPDLTPTDLGPAESALAPWGLSVSQSQGKVLIRWDAGVLQSADEVTGPWTDQVGASSPQTVTPSGARKFYRLRQ